MGEDDGIGVGKSSGSMYNMVCKLINMRQRLVTEVIHLLLGM